jgi:hypothetical protein
VVHVFFAITLSIFFLVKRLFNTSPVIPSLYPQGADRGETEEGVCFVCEVCGVGVLCD